MTKVINKKALLVLLTLVLAFCWLTVSVSAATVTESETLVMDPTPTLKGVSMKVYPAWYDNSTGKYMYDSGDGLYYERGSGYSPYNGTLPKKAADLDKYTMIYVELTYYVSGSNSYMVTFDVENPEIVNYSTRVMSGNHTIQYIVPKSYHTYELSVRPLSSTNTAWLVGHISLG